MTGSVEKKHNMKVNRGLKLSSAVRGAEEVRRRGERKVFSDTKQRNVTIRLETNQ